MFSRVRKIVCFILIAAVQFAFAQKEEKQKNNLFALYENACDQEGLFYFPPEYRGGFLSGSRLVNEKKLQSATKNKNYPSVAEAATNLAFIELQDGNNQKALSFFTIAEDAFAQLEQQREVAVYRLLKGFVHHMALEHEKASSLYNTGLRHAQQHNANDVKAVAGALIAQAYFGMKNFQEANKYFLQSYNDFGSLAKTYEKARIGVQIAELAIRKGRYNDAASYLDNALKTFVSTGDKAGQALVMRNKGIIAFRQNQYEKAAELFQKSMSLSDQLSVAKLLKDTYLKMFTIGSLAGDHQKSNEYNILYVSLRDSIDNIERSRILNSQFTRRDLVERESISEMLRKNSEILLRNLSPDEIEKNRQLIEVEIERLEKEKIIEDLNIAKKLSDQASMEREERIKQLTREKEQQDLALTQKELEVSKAQSARKNLFAAFAFIILVTGFLYNRYRNQRKSHDQLDKAYKELSETHQKLISAQEQLVHSQKMASLGQLTAGIAHEIQNPLNFINNFSELSEELLEEMKNSPDDQEKKEIMNDLITNLQKINIHGKRADKIVKGMLTHSRAGQVEKAAADINKMIDELLDLSYHGNRTRDNTFTAEIIKHLDPSLPKVEIVTQDISRVLINLFNNSFYAVGQRVKKEGPGFVASVGVSTSVEDQYVVIKIRDNGTGIPDQVKKKIFDPFFTTKPAGEGTGLGLSLSYHIIVKGHHGRLEVNSEPNSYTEFIIYLPFSN
jgi:signal transduction histidine kinase